jgi:hypothetical protein
MPETDSRDVENAPAPAQHMKMPCSILGISADGKKQTRFNPAAAEPFSDADDVSTLATALDAGGALYALVWVRGGETGNQYIVSFDENDRYHSRVELDSQEIVAQQSEIFGSGEVLLRGRRTQPDGARVAVMAAGGGPLRDVVGLPTTVEEPTAAPISDHIVRGGDGRIYFAPEGDKWVYVIEPSGDSQQAFRLATMPRNCRLVDLKAAGQRLAATYYEARPGGGRSWIAVYDIATGERMDVYGPAPGSPVCYEHDGARDRFTVLRDGSRLVRVAP